MLVNSTNKIQLLPPLQLGVTTIFQAPIWHSAATGNICCGQSYIASRQEHALLKWAVLKIENPTELLLEGHSALILDKGGSPRSAAAVLDMISKMVFHVDHVS